MTDQLRVNAHLIESLSSAVRHGGAALDDVPDLLDRVLDTGAWREFVTARSEEARWDRFDDFVAARPLKGLGGSPALIDRVIADRPALRDKVREARKVGHGPGRGHKTEGESPSVLVDDQTGKSAARLVRDHPDLWQQVTAGELSINAAAVTAGFRARRLSIRVDDPDSTARTLRKHMDPERLTRLRSLLDEP